MVYEALGVGRVISYHALVDDGSTSGRAIGAAVVPSGELRSIRIIVKLPSIRYL